MSIGASLHDDSRSPSSPKRYPSQALTLQLRWPPDELLVSVKRISNSSTGEQMLLITTLLVKTYETVEVTVRKKRQILSLEKHLLTVYGGYIVPYISKEFFQSEDQQGSSSKKQECMVDIAGEYLNELLQNPTVREDRKLYEFLFEQDISFQSETGYEKVLNDAAAYSRRYLNAIFARRPSQQNFPLALEVMELYGRFLRFRRNLETVRAIIANTMEQAQTVESVFGMFGEMLNTTCLAIQPMDYLPRELLLRTRKISRRIEHAIEAYHRWEVLSEIVRELQCNIYKGLQESAPIFKVKQKLFVSWTETLSDDFCRLIAGGEGLLHEVAEYFYGRKVESARLGAEIVEAMNLGVRKQVRTDSEREGHQKLASPGSESSEIEHTAAEMRAS